MKTLHRLIIICIFFLSDYAYSQQSIVFAHFNNTTTEINPAFAGYEGGTTFTSIYRRQWVDYPGTPNILHVSSDFALFKKSIGLAISYQNINESVFIRQKIQTSYSYKVLLNSKETIFFRIGLNILAENYQQSSYLNIITPNNNTDPAFLSTLSSRINFNVGTGILLQLHSVMLGISTTGLIENNSLFDSNIINAVSNKPIYGYLSFKVKVTEGLLFTPITLIRYENNKFGIDNSIKTTINNMIVFGINYRFMGDIGFTIGLIMNASLRMGYGYEPNIITTSTKIHGGTHEIIFKYKLFKKNYRLDSPRYLN